MRACACPAHHIQASLQGQHTTTAVTALLMQQLIPRHHDIKLIINSDDEFHQLPSVLAARLTCHLAIWEFQDIFEDRGLPLDLIARLAPELHVPYPLLHL
jgi:hypothetical protein